MGTYLSTPVTEKETESGAGQNKSAEVSYGVVDMQGWRKSMEDAYIIQTNVPAPMKSNDSHAMVFGIFDGHGGPEVARFCQLYFVDILINQECWNSGNKNKSDTGQALIGCFHGLDALLSDPRHRDEVYHLRVEKPDPNERRTVAGFVAANDDSQIMEEKKSEGGFKTTTNQDNDLQQHEEDSNPENSVQLLKRMLSMAKESVSYKEEGEEGEEESSRQDDLEEDAGTIDISGGDTGMGAYSEYSQPTEEEFRATKILNGRQVCNLPDHPIHAGCTSVCAVVENGMLTVANAGDSRIVLCRGGGKTEPMSYDHKPTDEGELKRVRGAGGFVNQFGRINGNLNLSRSIGDLKYKQVPGISPPNQMITAEPDIKQVELEPDDEFIILGCDGIWDCVTNEEAVQYVRERIDIKTPAEIGIELLDEIISDDPRTTAGIGGDNMTIMIVDLQPSARSYHS